MILGSSFEEGQLTSKLVQGDIKDGASSVGLSSGVKNQGNAVTGTSSVEKDSGVNQGP